jgi:small neutral amino acid transporter SnatA (MarC family)
VNPAPDRRARALRTAALAVASAMLALLAGQYIPAAILGPALVLAAGALLIYHALNP